MLIAIFIALYSKSVLFSGIIEKDFEISQNLPAVTQKLKKGKE